MRLKSMFRCPDCGAKEEVIMPLDACQYFYECRGCATLLRPLPGDCCVFCSYGDEPCPPMQATGEAGSQRLGD